MKPHNFNQWNRSLFSGQTPSDSDSHINELTGAMDKMERDRFELLSAYLDGELTASEKRQVEDWLANDQTVQCLYARLLKIRQGLRTLPVPQAHRSSETIQKVLDRLQRRSRLAVIGGTAIAAVFVGAISGILPMNESAPQLAQEAIQPIAIKPTIKPSGTLMVAVNSPVLPIPKAAISTPGKSLK
jgi:anti-sigma factor RsiW